MRSLVLFGALTLSGCAIQPASSTEIPLDPTGEVTPDSTRVRTPPIVEQELPANPAEAFTHVNLLGRHDVIRENVTGPAREMLPHPDPSPDPGPR
jgi:hypothetical protein